MSDGLDRIAAWFYQNYSKDVIFPYFIKLYFIKLYGNFQYFYETKKSFMKKVMSLILEEAIMSDRHMSVGQIYSFLQLFFNTGKIRLIE